jgi:tetratricopeptide (TPR) repeat protein
MQVMTDSARPAASYRNNWGNDIKVQIPDAGISIGEFDRYLHEWLGHQTRISGELYRTPNGIAVTAHIGDRSATLDGQEVNLGTLLQKTAEAVYGQTQPYRYATYLNRHGRAAESVEVLNHLSSDPSPVERAWAFIGLANHQDDIGDIHGAVAYFAVAQSQVPDFLMPVWDAQFDDEIFGHDEAVVAKGRKLLEALKSPNPYISERARTMMVQIIYQTQSSELADFNDVIAHAQLAEGLPDYQNGVEDGRQEEIAAYGFLHDPASMHRRLNQLPPANDANQAGRLTDLAVGEFMLARWQDSARDFGAVQTAVDRLGPGFSVLAAAEVWPYLAMADAAMGDRAHADALIAKMPLDCMWCAIARGRVDELDGKSGGASYWFSNAERQAPSVPYPDLYWGAMLLHRGEYGDAISKLARAHEKGPHFADPLEMWGEALMMQNHSDLAQAKFSQAAQYAPHWGRLHLKWGEALLYTGKADEARKQFAIAAGLDLSASDTIELAQMRAAHG